MIDLQGCVDVKVEEPIGNYHYLFSIQTSREWSSKGRKFLINASDNEDRKNWIECIKMALKIKVSGQSFWRLSYSKYSCAYLGAKLLQQ